MKQATDEEHICVAQARNHYPAAGVVISQHMLLTNGAAQVAQHEMPLCIAVDKMLYGREERATHRQDTHL